MKILALILAAEMVASGHVGLPTNQQLDVRLLRDKVSVRIHQALTFAFDQHGDRLVNPRLVRGAQKQPTVTVELTDEIPGDSTLLVTSTYRKVLVYHGAAHYGGKPAFVATSSYPVHPNAPDAQGFRGAIDEFVLWDFRLTK